MKRLKWLWIAWAVLVIPLIAAYAIDRLLLAPSCPDCHEEQTKALKLFTPESEGLVRIRASGLEFRARVAGFEENPDGEGVVLLHGFAATSIMWEEFPICWLPVLTNRFTAAARRQGCCRWSWRTH